MNYKAIAKWALGPDTGASSKAIATHLMGINSDGFADYPHDGGDFNRCETLLATVPEFRERLHEMANTNKYWAALVPRWDEIRASKDKYALIQSIIRPKEKTDRNHISVSDYVSIRAYR